MKHYFDINIATKYGMLEAVLLENIHYWTEKNRTEGRNFYDGKYWTYNSVKKFAELFPYASENQIKYALKNLREEGIVEVGNYNQHKMDKTLWYSLTEKGECLFLSNSSDDCKESRLQEYVLCETDDIDASSSVVDNSVDNFSDSVDQNERLDKIESSNRQIYPIESTKSHNRKENFIQAIPYINTDNNNTNINPNIDPYISYNFIYNDKTMDLMRTTEGRTYSTEIKHDYTQRESYSSNSRSMSRNRNTSRVVFDRPESKYKSKNKFLHFEQHEYTKSDIDMFEMAILRKQERMLC